MGGTDPDDVFQGVLHDGWLLSAISIVSASGDDDAGDDGVDPLIDQIFISKETSGTGAYAVQFNKNGQWEAVIVDDFFPMLDNKYKSSKCAGAAFAYSGDMKELWVPILEKAYAKYYGGYATLEHGFVHMALKDLTGGESHTVPLGAASRGASKQKLWNDLLKFKKNRYLLGA